MKSSTIFTVSGAFVLFVMQQVSAGGGGSHGSGAGSYGSGSGSYGSGSGSYGSDSGSYESGSYGNSGSCLNYNSCCYYAQEYYYNCVGADDCGNGDYNYCDSYYDTCSGVMSLDAPYSCKVCLNNYYYLSDGLGCGCCTTSGYCDDFEYPSSNNYNYKK